MTAEKTGNPGAQNQAAEELVVLEEYAKTNRKPPKAKHYKIRVDKQEFTVDVPSMMGQQILELADKTPPNRFKLFKIVHGTRVQIALTETVDFTELGIERFTTLPLDQTEGSAVQQEVVPGSSGDSSPPRRQFRLPGADEAHLNGLELRWETVIENNVRRLVIYDYPICSGYTVTKVNLYLRIETGYPDAQIDMVYFHPALVRTDAKGINALSTENFDGLTWQRWSRHRTPANAWVAGQDCVETQLLLIDHWFEREFTQR